MHLQWVEIQELKLQVKALISKVGNTTNNTTINNQTYNQQTNVQPGSDATVWTILAQGDTAAVLTTRGDILFESSGGVSRLPIGMPGSVLASDGLDVKWSDISGKNILYVAPTGDDNNPGTESLPYRSVQAACTKAKEASITEVQNVNGGTGGTANVYNNIRAVAYKELTVSAVPSTTSFEVSLGTSTYTHTYVSGGEVLKTDDTSLTVTNAPYNNSTGVLTITTSGAHGLSISDTVRVRGLDYTCAIGAKTYPETGEDSYFRVDTTGASPVISVTNGTAHHNVGDKLRIDGSLIGGATTLTADVKSIASDVIKVANGEYKEVLPLRVRPRVSIIGESLRNCRVSPTTGSGTQIKTVSITNNFSGGVAGEYKYVHPYKIEKSLYCFCHFKFHIY